MTAPYSGGLQITELWLEGINSLRILFTSTYDTTYQYQVYVNRVLSGFSESASDRVISCNWESSLWPQYVQILAVDPAELSTDYGADLPPRPYNQIKAGITTSGWTDVGRIEITSGTTPGGAVDSTNVIGVLLFDTNRTYYFITPPLAGKGTWYLESIGIDNTSDVGNPGTAGTASAFIYAIPPDFTPQSSGTRFGLSTSSGNLVIAFTEAI